MEDKRLEKAIIFLHDEYENWRNTWMIAGDFNPSTIEALGRVMAAEEMISKLWNMEVNEVNMMRIAWECEHIPA